MELTKKQLMILYTNMVRVRKLDEMMVKMCLEGKGLVFFHSQQGQEAVGVGACTFLRKDDYLCYGHRGHGIGKLLPKGMSPKAILAEHQCRAGGSCGGMSMFHAADIDLGIPGISGTLGGEFIIAVGMGISAQMRGKGQVVVCAQGEGGYARGTFHESMIMAANWKLPVIFIVENNKYMGCTPQSEIHPVENLADLAVGYGVSGGVIDGQDVVAVYEAVQDAVNRARGGEGPSLIEFKTYRFRAHAEGVPDLRIVEPRPQDEIDAWKKRDPIGLFQGRLLKEGFLTQADIDRIDGDAESEINDALQFADESPRIEPELLKNALYAE